MIELIRARRSIRAYTKEPVDRQSVDLLAETLLRAPTSRNNKPWEFVVVDDPQLLEGLAKAKEHGSTFLKGAPLAIVVCADADKSDVWVEDCSIASILVQMTAQSLGLGSCWVQIRKRPHDRETTAEAFIRELLGLPERLNVEAVIGIGHPAEKRVPVPARELGYGKVKRNRYDEPYSG